MIDKLQAHYGFTRMPFGRDLAPGMLHRHAAHNEAVARITWCITERSIGVITGEVGAGKTVSVRTVLAGLDASRHTIIYLPNPMIGVRGLHEMIVATFGGQPDRSGSRLTAQASAILAAERDERGKTPVLVIDEAHLLRYEQLETIRMLTNHNLDADSPLACLLVGQPTLRRTMKLAVLAALEQRVALRYAMLAIPWKCGHFPLVDSCNFGPFLTIERQFTFIDLAPAGTRIRWSPDAPRAGRGRLGLPAFPGPGAAGGSALKAGLGVYMCQAAGRFAVVLRSQPGLDAEGRPRILARRVPRPQRGSPFLKVSGGEAASFLPGAAQRPAALTRPPVPRRAPRPPEASCRRTSAAGRCCTPRSRRPPWPGPAPWS